MPVIRPIQPKDDTQMKAILQACLEEADLAQPGTAYYDPQIGALAEYYARLPRAGYFVAVAADNDDLVLGGCGFGPVGPDAAICELQKLYLTPAARGQGLSKRLLARTMAAAQAAGYRQLYVVTDTKLPIANLLYQAQGFTRLAQPLAGDEHNGCDTWYLKSLE